MLGPVLLPEQHQRHAAPPELGMDPRPVRLRARRPPSSNPARREQTLLQVGVVQPGRHRPGDADHRRTAEILGHRVAADSDRGSDLPVALAAGVLEAKNFSDLAHGQSLSGHRHSPATLPDRACPRWTTARRPPPQRPVRVAGLPRNGWLAWTGFSGWFASNHRLDSRNPQPSRRTADHPPPRQQTKPRFSPRAA